MDHERWYAFGRHQNLDKQEIPKLAVARLVDRLKLFYDGEGAFYLDNVDVNGIILKEDVPERWHYVLGLLNSKLLDFVFKKGTVRFRGRYYSANKQFIQDLPIHWVDFSDPEEKAQHDELVACAQIMLDRNREKNKAIRGFNQALRNHPHELQPLVEKLRDRAVAVLDVVEKSDLHFSSSLPIFLMTGMSRLASAATNLSNSG